jgi:hypothetical protein
MKLIRTIPILWCCVCFLGIAFADQPSSPLRGVGVSIVAGTQSHTGYQDDVFGGSRTIAYGIQQSSDRLIIEPKLLFVKAITTEDNVVSDYNGKPYIYDDYLGILKNGRPIYPISDDAEAVIALFPELDVRMINNSGRTLFFSKAVINVSRSTPNDEPLLMLFSGFSNDRDCHEVFHFEIRNDGGALSIVLRWSST